VLTVDVDETRGSGTVSAWNVYMPLDAGIQYGQTHLTTVGHCNIANTYNGTRGGGNGLLIDESCVFPSDASMSYRVQHTAGAGVKVRGGYAPPGGGAGTGVAEFVRLTSVNGVDVQIFSGDVSGSGQMVDLNQCFGIKLLGNSLQTASTAAAFKLTSCRGALISGNTIGTGSGGAVVDYSGGGNFDIVHLPNYRVAPTIEYLGTFGTHVQNSMVWDGTRLQMPIAYLSTKLSAEAVYAGTSNTSGSAPDDNTLLLGSNRVGAERSWDGVHHGGIVETASALQHGTVGTGWLTLYGDQASTTSGVAIMVYDTTATNSSGGTNTKLLPAFRFSPSGFQMAYVGGGASPGVSGGLLTVTSSGDWAFGSKKLTAVALPTASKDVLVKQSGSATLVSGTVTVSTPDLNAQSVVVVQRTAVGGTAGAHLVVTAKSNGTPGSFTVTSKDSAGTTVATDTSTFDWQVL
jgi:hypothetical protein